MQSAATRKPATDGRNKTRTLFLNPPSYAGFDGGAGARYQAKREIRSFWYPTWLAQPAALVADSLLVDAPPADQTLQDVIPLAAGRELAVIYTSSPTFAGDIKVAEALKEANPSLLIGFAGPTVAVEPERSLLASPSIDFVAREEFDFTVKEVAEGRPLAEVAGLSYKGPGGPPRHNPDRELLTDMDSLPFVTPVYKRDLRIEDYYIGYLKHPYVSLYTGRGCRSRCTFCLWPQTVGGHVYRTRSVGSVLDEAALVKELFPQMKELFFDDDTFTDDRERAAEIARGLYTARSSLACRERRGRRSGSPATSTRTPSRCLSPPPTREPSCTGRHCRTAGSPPVTKAPRSSAIAGPSSRRCPTRSSAGRRSSNRWTPSTGGSTSGPTKSPRCPRRYSAARRPRPAACEKAANSSSFSAAAGGERAGRAQAPQHRPAR